MTTYLYLWIHCLLALTWLPLLLKLKVFLYGFCGYVSTMSAIFNTLTIFFPVYYVYLNYQVIYATMDTLFIGCRS